MPTRRDQHAQLREVGIVCGRPRDKRVHQDDVIEEIRVSKDNCGENVGSVGIAEADGARRLRLLFVARTKFHSATSDFQILEVINAFGLAPEKAQSAALRNVAARRTMPASGNASQPMEGTDLVAAVPDICRRVARRRSPFLLPVLIAVDAHGPSFNRDRLERLFQLVAQMRVLLREFQRLVEMRLDRPELKPGPSVETSNRTPPGVRK